MSPTIHHQFPHPTIIIQPFPSPDDFFQKRSQIDHWSTTSSHYSLSTFCSFILNTLPYYATYPPTSIRISLRSTHSHQNMGVILEHHVSTTIRLSYSCRHCSMLCCYRQPNWARYRDCNRCRSCWLLCSQ